MGTPEEDKMVSIKDQNALIMGNGKVYKIQKVRQRKIHSCVPCHQRKVKCSRETPVCSNCIKNGLECKYFVNDRVSRGKKSKDLDKEADLKRKKELKEYMERAKLMAKENPSASKTIDIKSPSEMDTASITPSITGTIDSLPGKTLSAKMTTSTSLNSENDSNSSPKNKSLTFSDSDSLISNESLSPPKLQLHNPNSLQHDKHISTLSSISENVPQQQNQFMSSSSNDITLNNNNNNNNNNTNTNNDFQFNDTQTNAGSDYGFKSYSQQHTSNSHSQQYHDQRQQQIQQQIQQHHQQLQQQLQQQQLQQQHYQQHQHQQSQSQPQQAPQQQASQSQIPPLSQHIRNDSNKASLLSQIYISQPVTIPLQLTTPYILPEPNQTQVSIQPHNQHNQQQSSEINDGLTPKEREIVEALPSRQRSYGLVKRYISTIHPIIPIIDINEFLLEHDKFWNDQHEDRFEFMTCLYPILYAASKAECFEFSYDEITKYELSNEIHKYLRIAREVFALQNFPLKYSLRTIQSAVLLQSTLENPSISDISILVRIAQAIKLHRDPANYHNISDPQLVQVKRLLWWEIFYLDAQTSLIQMVTPLIKLDEFDTSLPMEFISNELNVEICNLNGKFRFALILNELTKFIYGITILPFNTIQLLKQKILDLHISCNASIMNLSNLQQIKQLTFQEMNFINWSKSVLNTYSDRALLILQNKIILSNHVLNTNENENNHIFNNSYNQMMNNDKMRFNIDYFFKNGSINNNNNGNQSSSTSLNDYSYDDLSNNLMPAALHYVYEFWKNNNDDIYNSYNWEIRNTLPFDAIILILTNLISDLEKNFNNLYELKNDIRYYLLDKSIDLIFIKFDNKKRSILKNCFTLMRYLFQILRLKYLKNNSMIGGIGGIGGTLDFTNFNTEQIIPKPLKNQFDNPINGNGNGNVNNNTNNLGITTSSLFDSNNNSSNGSSRHESFSQEPISRSGGIPQNSYLSFGTKNSQNNLFYSSGLTTTSCSQIAPRAMRTVAAATSTAQISPFGNLSNNHMLRNGSGHIASGNTTFIGDDLNTDTLFGDFTNEDEVWNPTQISLPLPIGSNNSSNGTNTPVIGLGDDGFNDDEYKRLELQRIKLQITKFLTEERLSDDDKFNNKYYIWCEHEIKQLIERLI
ncbi:putative transcriptional regulatory protein [Wickerhamomyces ciferrii]|uniref:Transcriptional regulatory protein n=1 Tax=Wickerhamomyces ciferrii (strain ATCC 14091 / BCRC 22168 / CBS 111 / JCM 3599 / NBRC 0793 / NRRL Y-1031 F-60-10) TaxID=1206466 RepID=K0KXI6_WICCF|nr:putative transcriptional regulatory protein [Wickerhamomyces ciferrii]CCH46752.1 putative transcriptional regulatory protein [Wickerhamomyces ciferrii]